MSWMSAHYWPVTNLSRADELGHGSFGIYAAKESGRHPDTGYAAHCWTVNLNAPVGDRIRNQVLDICQRTGLAGFLWDSFSNLGWWQVDYSDGTMRPQFDKMGDMFAAFTNAGLYIHPEAVVSFTSHSGCGLFGGNVYAGDLLGYSYNTVIGLRYADDGDDKPRDQADEILRGNKPFDLLFRCFAHRRVPSVHLHKVPREEWDPVAERRIKELFAAYRKHKDLMQKRTVLKDDAGVLWETDRDWNLLFSFKEQTWDTDAVDALTDEKAPNNSLVACRVYLVK
jgi:hypothetical protein